MKRMQFEVPKRLPHELPIFRQSLQWRMYHVPYSMSGFLQLIADGSPNKHQRKKKGKGRNRREYKRTPSRKHSVNNFWIRIVERNRFPDLTSFWLHFALKECSLKFTKGSPHELPNFRQSLHWQMYDVPYSMYGFLQLIADGSPNKHQRKKKSKGRNRREYKRTPSRKHSVNNFWIRIVERNRLPELTSFWLRFIERMQFEVHKRAPPTSCEISGNHWQMYHVHPYSMYGFLQLIIDGSPNKHPGRKERQGEQVVVTPRLPQQNALQHCFHAEITVVPLRNWFESQAAAAIHASCQKPKKIYFPGSKWIAGNILCIGFFTDSGRCFVRPKLSILCSMYPI